MRIGLFLIVALMVGIRAQSVMEHFSCAVRGHLSWQQVQMGPYLVLSRCRAWMDNKKAEEW